MSPPAPLILCIAAGADKTFIVPTNNTWDYDWYIDWGGDDSPEDHVSGTGAADTGIDHSFPDDAVARVVKSESGFLWACQNYDGDVMSDMIASVSGNVAMMTSVLVSPSGKFEYEAAHGTVQQHYCRRQNGEKTSANSIALIFAWTGALAKRAELDATPELGAFATKLEKAVLDTIEGGEMTGDLARIAQGPKKILDSWEFIDAVAGRLGQS